MFIVFGHVLTLMTTSHVIMFVSERIMVLHFVIQGYLAFLVKKIVVAIFDPSKEKYFVSKRSSCCCINGAPIIKKQT